MTDRKMPSSGGLLVSVFDPALQQIQLVAGQIFVFGHALPFQYFFFEIAIVEDRFQTGIAIVARMAIAGGTVRVQNGFDVLVVIGI